MRDTLCQRISSYLILGGAVLGSIGLVGAMVTVLVRMTMNAQGAPSEVYVWSMYPFVLGTALGISGLLLMAAEDIVLDPIRKRKMERKMRIHR